MSKITINAPCNGWACALGEAPDPVFADAILGDGLLIDPTEGVLRAPCSGVVASIARTRHALSLRTDAGAEILLHVGLESVALEGEGFSLAVVQGQAVQGGAELMRFDMDVLAAKAASLLIPVIITNGEAFEIVRRRPDGPVRAGDFLMHIRAISAPPETSAPSSAGAIRAAQSVVLPLAHGLHARPAARLAGTVKGFAAKIMVAKDGREADARSPAALMGLGTRLGDHLVISATGADAKGALAAVTEAIAQGLGETPQAVSGPEAAAHADPDNAAMPEPVEPVTLDGATVLQGVCGAPGLVCGTVVRLDFAEKEVREQGGGEKEERAALMAALERVRERLQALRDTDQPDAILEAHLALLDDPVLLEKTLAVITRGKSAAFAWRQVCQTQAQQWRALGDARMAERAADMKDLQNQVLAALDGEAGDDIPSLPEQAIIVSREILPSQMVRLAAAGARGICTIGGGPTAHVSIMAADRGMAALVAAGPRLCTIPDGTAVILDAAQGRLHVAPSAADIKTARALWKKRQRNDENAVRHAREACCSQDGVRIEVFANLGSEKDASQAVALGAEGCGLLRSEFLFFGRSTPPDEKEQMARYQSIADALQGRPLIIRTLDAGSDKPLAFLPMGAEDNPALGVRGIRLAFQRSPAPGEALFRTQIRAILQLRATGPVRIMLPMIVDPGEVRRVRQILDEERRTLGISTSPPLGIMVETPAAAMLADALAKEVDFFSIGSNDLSQYALAMDRGNAALASRIDALHPAVLRLIGLTANAGAAAGKPVGVCGAMASDLAAVPVLLGLGVDELSAHAARIPAVKALIRTLDVRQCQERAAQLLTLASPEAVRARVRQYWPHSDDWS